VMHLSVDPQCRRRGVGKALMRTLMGTAQSSELNIRELVLSTALDLHAARALYAGLGFVETHVEDIGGGCVMCHLSLCLGLSR